MVLGIWFNHFCLGLVSGSTGSQRQILGLNLHDKLVHGPKQVGSLIPLRLEDLDLKAGVNGLHFLGVLRVALDIFLERRDARKQRQDLMRVFLNLFEVDQLLTDDGLGHVCEVAFEDVVGLVGPENILCSCV